MKEVSVLTRGEIMGEKLKQVCVTLLIKYFIFCVRGEPERMNALRCRILHDMTTMMMTLMHVTLIANRKCYC